MSCNFINQAWEVFCTFDNIYIYIVTKYLKKNIHNNTILIIVDYFKNSL